MTKAATIHMVPLDDGKLELLIAGLDLVARNLGAGQQQQGLAAIAEASAKSAPVLALAHELSAFISKSPPDKMGAQTNAPPPAPAGRQPNRKERRAGAKS